jgi:hypothetical protein
MDGLSYGAALLGTDTTDERVVAAPVPCVDELSGVADCTVWPDMDCSIPVCSDQRQCAGARGGRKDVYRIVYFRCWRRRRDRRGRSV